MKISLILIILIVLTLTSHAQKKNYNQYDTCIAWEVHKGKKDHGKKYCVGWATIREYQNGRKDTIGWGYSGKTFGDEYEQYKGLSERGKYIVDSLQEDGITQYQQAYLTYEPMYMKDGKKVECLWRIDGKDVIIFEYLFWKNDNGHGIELKKEIILK